MTETLPVWRQPVIGETLPRAAVSLPGLELVDVSPGAATFEMPLTGWLEGPQDRSVAHTRADVVNDEGKIVAMATATSLYR